MFKRARYERRTADASLELALLRPRLDCSCSRADAHPGVCSRAHSDTGVGSLLFWAFVQILFLKMGHFPDHFVISEKTLAIR